ncbi:uncharacterized protein LOC117104270 isoform X2 [Anneissia japonica]|uniref:uncharacterized protein LOC117104270 isoform X2 n=1 Tax=Anneissia japonica TaxID=1529436 RepID=UPI00142559D6|nr:uncharacterized protein LOC117104270 isoform X2 [Anneissia japonica]
MYLRCKLVANLLTLFISTTDIVRAVFSCKDLELCPIPKGLGIAGLDNGVVDPWPPVRDTDTSMPCLPNGKDKMKFICDDGFRLQTTEVEIFCDEQYNWNQDAPTCVDEAVPSKSTVHKPPPPPPCNECADESLLIVIIVLALMFLMSWVIFILIFTCKRSVTAVGNTIPEPIIVHSRSRPTNIHLPNNSIQLRTRPPMPEPREVATSHERDPQYDYADTSKIKQNCESDYLEPYVCNR